MSLLSIHIHRIPGDQLNNTELGVSQPLRNAEDTERTIQQCLASRNPTEQLKQKSCT